MLFCPIFLTQWHSLSGDLRETLLKKHCDEMRVATVQSCVEIRSLHWCFGSHVTITMSQCHNWFRLAPLPPLKGSWSSSLWNSGGKHVHSGNYFDVCKQKDDSVREGGRGAFNGFRHSSLTEMQHILNIIFWPEEGNLLSKCFLFLFCFCLIVFSVEALRPRHTCQIAITVMAMWIPSLLRCNCSSLADTWERLTPLIVACVSLSC